MKKCPGCSYLWADDYNGTCLECGKPLGNVGMSQDLTFRYANQVAAGRREAESESALKRGRYDSLRVNDNVLDMAREAARALERAAGRSDD